jgi:competence protein ComEC
MTTNLYPEYDYGDFLKVSGFLKTPPKIDGFDYENYLARYDIYSVMYYPKIEKISGDLNFSQKIFLSLINFKQYLKTIIDKNIPESEAGLANALLLGYKRTVDREDMNIFSRVGLSHMIAISGSHITILSAMIINFFIIFGFNRRQSLFFVLSFLFIYPLITGLSASAVRSAIMGGLSFLALYFGRASNIIYALVFSGALMLLFNPRLLRDDIGFQLSYLAILGIIYLYPYGEEKTEKIFIKLRLKHDARKKINNIFSIINLTLVSQIITLPVLLINFHTFSVIAPLANLLVIWTFPPLLACLLIGLIFSAIMPFLGSLWFFPSYLLLKYIFVVSSFLSSPAWAAISDIKFNWFYGFVYYLILIIVIWRKHKQKTTY